MGDNLRRSETTHTSYRLTDTVRAKLDALAILDGCTRTEALKHLINAGYKARLDDIKDFRENLKTREKGRETKEI